MRTLVALQTFDTLPVAYEIQDVFNKYWNKCYYDSSIHDIVLNVHTLSTRISEIFQQYKSKAAIFSQFNVVEFSVSLFRLAFSSFTGWK